MKGLLFTPEMARAVCEGRKTQTRRVIKLPVIDKDFGCELSGGEIAASERDTLRHAPYRPGNRVCLLTTWAVPRTLDGVKPRSLPESLSPETQDSFWHAGQGPRPEVTNGGLAAYGKLRPGRFLPNHLRPLMPQLEIVSVRAERVQDISEEDAKAEGIERIPSVGFFRAFGWKDYSGGEGFFDARESFKSLWDSINAKRGGGWQQNPWVWVVAFRRVKS